MEDRYAALETSVILDIKKAPNCGILVWRCKKFSLEKIIEEEFGTFYDSNCYVILELYNKYKKETSKGTVVHFWLGKNSSQDEQDFVAIMATHMDKHMEINHDLNCVISREVQGDEGNLTRIFKPFITKRGDCCSEFKQATTRFHPHLYEVKGKVVPRVTELECKTSSLHSEDCYILDARPTYGVFILEGKKSNLKERQRTLQIANTKFTAPRILEEENINKDSLSKKICQKCLGVSESREVKFHGVRNTSDEEHEQRVTSKTKLYRISDEYNNFVEVPQILQSNLNSGDCFVLTTESKVFVWKGSKSSTKERLDALTTANEFIKAAGLSKNVRVDVIPENSEPVEFTACFPQWTTKDKTDIIRVDNSKPSRKTSTSGAPFQVTDFRTLYNKDPPQKDDPYSDDDGSGQVKIFLVKTKNRRNKTGMANRDELQQMDREKFVFNSSDTYLIEYSCTKRKQVIIYYWIGNESDQAERGNAALLAISLDDEVHNGSATQVRVFQGREPLHFMRIFNGYIMIKQERLERNSSRLFHVRGKENNIKVVEVPVDGSYLSSNDCFILMSDKRKVYIWFGTKSLGDEQEFAKVAATDMFRLEYQLVEEKSTPDAFWRAIGGKKEYKSSSVNQVHGNTKVFEEREPILFHLYDVGHGLQSEIIYDFVQDDLIDNDDDVFLLDIFSHLFIWFGRNCTIAEKKATLESISVYIENDQTPRTLDDVLVTTVCQGFEPPKFKECFSGWEEGRISQMTPEEAKLLQIDGIDRKMGCVMHKNQLLVFDAPISTFYPYEVLRGKKQEDLPPEVFADFKEMYLKDEEFQLIFQMTKQEFLQQKEWIRINLKKERDLF